MKKWFIGSLFAIILSASVMTGGQALSFSDMPSDWSRPALEAAVENGLMSGYDGKIHPYSNLTRAEMATLINNAFGAQKKASLDAFTDVAPGAWYYGEMQKAVAMKTFVGSGNRLNPDDSITRQEVFVVIARAFGLSGGDRAVLSRFSDGNQVDGWATDDVASLVASGYVKGDGVNLHPKSYITRAEFAQIMYNIVGTYVTSASVVSGEYEKSVVVKTGGVSIRNASVSGDIIMADGVGEGSVIVGGTKAAGRLVVRGGSTAQIMSGSEFDAAVVMKMTGSVKVISQDDSVLGAISVSAGDGRVTLEGSLKDVAVNVSGCDVVLQNAQCASVALCVPTTAVTVMSGSHVQEIAIDAAATGGTVKVDGTAGNIEVNADNAGINGYGKVESVSIAAKNVRMEIPGVLVTVADTVPYATICGALVDGGVSGISQVSGGVSGIQTVTVTFDSTGGSAVAPQTVMVGGKIIAPDEPVRLGFLFSGWYQDAGCTRAWDFAYGTADEDMTLYAGWHENTLARQIAGAADGATINVPAGTYECALLVENKSITLIGSGEVVITGPKNHTSLMSVPAVGDDEMGYAAVVTVKNGSLTMNNITVRQDASTAPSGCVYAGIVSVNSDLAMENCKVYDKNGKDCYLYCEDSVCVYAASASKINTLSVRSCNLSGFAYSGIITNKMVDITLIGTTITGVGVQGEVVQYGLRFSGNAVISQNTFKDMWYTISDYDLIQATAIARVRARQGSTYVFSYTDNTFTNVELETNEIP